MILVNKIRRKTSLFYELNALANFTDGRQSSHYESKKANNFVYPSLADNLKGTEFFRKILLYEFEIHSFE